jgi:hypothetical protein
MATTSSRRSGMPPPVRSTWVRAPFTPRSSACLRRGWLWKSGIAPLLIRGIQGAATIAYPTEAIATWLPNCAAWSEHLCWLEASNWSPEDE